MSSYEGIIGAAIMGETTTELGMARVTCKMAASHTMFCRSCGGILDQSTVQVLETGEQAMAAYCGVKCDILQWASENLQALVDEHGCTATLSTWDGAEVYEPAGE